MQYAADCAKPLANRLITRGDWYRPGESLWSVCHKLTYLNQLSGTEVHSTLMNDSRKKGAQIDSDLRYWNQLDFDRVSEATGFDLRYATVDAFLLQDTPLTGSNALRYCPQCLRQGLHSTIHWLPYIDRCPWHDEALQTTCSHGQAIPSRLTSSALGQPYACVHGKPLWPGISQKEWKPTLTETQIQDVQKLLKWISKLKYAKPLRHNNLTKGLSTNNLRPARNWTGIDARLPSFLHRIFPGPAWLDQAVISLPFGELIVQEYGHLRYDGRLLFDSSVPLNIPVRPSEAIGGDNWRGLPDDHVFFEEVLGNARAHLRCTLTDFRRQYLLPHLRCRKRLEGTPDQNYARPVCLLWQSYCSAEGALALRDNWREYNTLDRWAEPVRILYNYWEAIDGWMRLDRKGRIMTFQRFEVMRWITERLAESLVLYSIEAAMSQILFSAIHRGLNSGETITPTGQSLFSPTAVAAEGRKGPVQFYGYRMIKQEQWRALSTDTTLCEYLSKNRHSATVLREQLEQHDLKYLPNLRGESLVELLK